MSNKLSSDDKSSDAKNLLEVPPSDEIEKLKKEIKDLEDMCKQLQQELKAVRLNNMKISTNSQNAIADTKKQVVPINLNLNHDLYKFSGLYCAHNTNTQCVIVIHSLWEHQKKNLFAIEFIKRNKKIQVGKWVMPISVDIKQLLIEVPLNTIEDIIPFARNCKQHVDCYLMRLQQYKKFKSFLDNLNNCNVQTDLGYTMLILELSHVYDKIRESYTRITIFLRYDSKSNRPNQIKFEINEDLQCEEETKKGLKKSLKVFYTDDLVIAFGKILKKDSAQFIWERRKKDGNILENNESISSSKDEDSLSSKKFKDKISRKRQNESMPSTENVKKVKINEKLEQPNENIIIQKQLDIDTKASTTEHMKNAHSRKKPKLRGRRSHSIYKLRSRKKPEVLIIKDRLRKVRSYFTSTPKKRAKKLSPTKNLTQLDISDIVIID
ncbi:hypothetical protein M0802_003412 [Mischocyttarus mexicanus]|nr:hypothetical protein M0802_003412 [Mischocyttarus mexicanus]